METQIKTAQAKLATAVAEVTAAQKGIQVWYEYENLDGQPEYVKKVVVKDGAFFANFLLDLGSLEDGLKSTVEAYYLDRYGYSIAESVENFESALQEWLRFEDDYYIRETLVWKRASFDSGEVYILEVPSDAEVCEDCDKVLGNYTAVEIWAAIRVPFKSFVHDRLSELVRIQHCGGEIRWDVRTGFLATIIAAIQRWNILTPSDLKLAPESEWVELAEKWNKIVSFHSSNLAPTPNDSEFWAQIYQTLND